MKKVWKKICGAALLFGLLVGSAGSAMAHEVPDADTAGSITVELKYEDAFVTGGSFAAYRVGNVTEDDGNYFFTLAEAYADTGLALDDVEDDALSEALAEYISENGIAADAAAENETGEVVFSDLEIGLYLIVQTVACDGYEAVSPFLVSVPYYDGETYLYNVTATSKMDLLTLTPAKEEEEEAAEETLPQTGQLNWPIPLLAVSGLVLILAGKALRSSQPRTKKPQANAA